MNLLAGVRLVSTAQNLPGPAACARLRDWGASLVKIEPLEGDAFERYNPDWYARLHAGAEVLRIDLKSDAGREALDRHLAVADLLVTAQRPAALERMGLAGESLAARFPRLCHVALSGHAPPHDSRAGHDLTYMAEQGLLTPPHLPATLFADMAGAERAVSAALALLVSRDRGGSARHANVSLAEAAGHLAMPLREGLTRPGALLGGGFAGYNLYEARGGWIALAVLEPRFAQRLADLLGIPSLEEAALRTAFTTRTPYEWEAWAKANDLPLAAVRSPLSNS